MISAAPSTRKTSQEFMTSLSRLPAPASPSHLVSRPSAAYTGSSTGLAASGPEARISSWPFSAGRRVPDTGASAKYTSGRSLLTRAASSSVAVTPIVLICDQTASGRIASSIPNPNATWFTAVRVRDHGDHHVRVPHRVRGILVGGRPVRGELRRQVPGSGSTRPP